MGKAFKDIAKISSATIGSRVLGLVRDSASMAYLSIGAVSAAYTFAFTLPNLFRRLLGEGALTSALVPVFTKTMNEDGQDAAFAFLNRTVTRAFMVLAALVLIGMATCAVWLIFADKSQERFFLGASYSIVLMPYMLLICLAAVFSAALNVLGSFGVPSVGPILLNISIILGLFLGMKCFGDDTQSTAYFMCLGWLVGGVIQAGMPAYCLRKRGWRFSPDFGKCPALDELVRLFVPALIGAAVMQLNIFVSKMLALFISNDALPSLYLSGRILEFPLGVFAIAIATVYFPKLSMLNASMNLKAFKAEYARGIITTMSITIPATIGIAVLSTDIISLLFRWGMFTARDVEICVPVLFVSILGLPAFAMAGFATRGFHSGRDTRTPVKVSYWSFGTNIVFSLALMWKFGAAGLAAANVLAAVVQAVMLNAFIKLKYGSFETGAEIFKIMCAAAAMGAFTIFAKYVSADFISDEKLLSLFVCAAVIPVSALFYLACLKIVKFKQTDDLFKMFSRKKKNAR